MRLLVISHSAVIEVNRAMFQALSRQGAAEVTMIVPAEYKGDLIRDLAYRRTEGDAALRVIPLPVALSGRNSLFFFKASLRKALGGWEPDLVFVDEEPWSMAALQAFVEFRHLPVAFFTEENLDKWIPWPFTWLQKWVLRRAAAAFAVSREGEDLLRAKGYQGETYSFWHSYDPRAIRRLEAPERAQARKELGIPEGVTCLAYVGRLTPEKGIADLIQALRTLDPIHRDWFFLCVGNGVMRDEMAQALRALPDARYKLVPAIPHDQVGRAFGAIDVLVLPSRTTKRWKEQFGRVLVEAMACGAAVVGSDSGEIPNLVRRSRGGLVFKEGDAADLAAKLGELITDGDLLSRHREAGRRYVDSHLTHEAMARDFGAKLRAILAEAGKQ